MGSPAGDKIEPIGPGTVSALTCAATGVTGSGYGTTRTFTPSSGTMIAPSARVVSNRSRSLSSCTKLVVRCRSTSKLLQNSMQFWVYGVGWADGDIPDTHWEAMQWLKGLGFRVNPETQIWPDEK